MGRTLRWIAVALVGTSVFYALVVFVARTEPTFPPPYALQGLQPARPPGAPPPPMRLGVTCR